MHRVPLACAVLAAFALLPTTHDAHATAITSQILIDPAGENDGDIFGCSIANAGDLNGDGYDDLVIGANFYPSEGGRGRVYLYYGGPGIDTIADLAIPSPTGTVQWFGISVASAGDFNGDGWPDIIVGARYTGLQGKAYIFYGGPTMDATPDVTLTGETTGSGTWFGASVAGAGDVNGDGIDDVVVGAPMYGTSNSQNGRAYVYFGGHTPDTTPDLILTGAANGDQLGTVVGSAGDLNGDGHPDVFASAPYNDVAGTDAGAVYVWYGGPGLHTTPDLTILGSGTNEHLQHAANAGDVNQDGYSDLIVGGYWRVKVYFGGATPNTVPDLTFARAFGQVAGAGDVNGDGADDFMIGDPDDDTNGTNAGRVQVFFGGAALDTLEDLHFYGDGPGRFFGRTVAAGGRIDGPGPADLLVSADEDPEQVGYDRGRVYVIANALATTDVPRTPATGLEFVGAQPNPARADVNLVFALDHAVRVRVGVYDLAGREVARPIADEWLAGNVTRTWRPAALETGVYYVRAQLGMQEIVKKMVWLGSHP